MVEPLRPDGGSIRVIIADGQGVVREGLALLLRGTADLEVVATAGNAEDAVTLVAEHHPDVLLIEISLPGATEAIHVVSTTYPSTKVLMLTSLTEPADVSAGVQAGAIGFLFKDFESARLIDEIRAAGDGQSPFDPEAAREVLEVAHSASADVHLTARETEVLALIAEGMSNKRIAQSLGISEKTVKVHVSHILQVIGVNGRTQAALWARDHRLPSSGA